MKYAWHVFKYILVFVINLLILLFVHSYFNFIVMILMIVLPVVSIVCTFVLSRHLTVKFGGGGRTLRWTRHFSYRLCSTTAALFRI